MKKYKKVYKLFNELSAKQQNKFLEKIGIVSEDFIPIEYLMKKILKIDDTDDFLSETSDSKTPAPTPELASTVMQDKTRNVTEMPNNNFTSTCTCNCTKKEE
jgi:hypothetical protein